MKNHFLILVLFLMLPFLINAQVLEQERSMSKGVNNALVLEIPMADPGMVEKLWKKYMKDYDAKTKKVKGEPEWLSDNADIPGIGNGNTMDVYSKIAESGEDVELIAWFDLGGAFLDSNLHPDNYMEGEKFLMRFSLYVEKEKTQLELEAQEKELKNMEKDLKDLERGKERLLDVIADAERRIEEAKADIEQNEKDQDAQKKVIEDQLEVIKKVQKKLDDL
jgi:hypothetical protein